MVSLRTTFSFVAEGRQKRNHATTGVMARNLSRGNRIFRRYGAQSCQEVHPVVEIMRANS
jgi:hypothetical protein